MSCFQSGHYIGYNLGQNRQEIYTPPPLHPNQGWENGAFWLSHGYILDLGGCGVLFHFILSKIAASSTEDVSPWLSDRFLLCHRGGT